MKDPRTLRAKWVAALRSGDYTQGFGQLCYLDDNNQREYCVWGVACEVADIPSKIDLHTKMVLYDGKGGAPPKSVVEAMGLSYAEKSKLIEDNDNYEMSFSALADYIESLSEPDT